MANGWLGKLWQRIHATSRPDRLGRDLHALGMGLRVIGVGSAIGLGASLALSRILASQLWQTSAHDPLTICGVAILLLAIGVAACVVPARRATSIEPTLALRYE